MDNQELRNLIAEQRLEYERLALQPYIPRTALAAAKAMLSSSLVKVISGPRRAGKSTFAIQLLASRKIAYLNFDDDNLISLFKLKGTQGLESALSSVYGDFEFCLLDEIQNLPAWELLVNKLHRRRVNLLITGSNSRLLSSELATHLTGRYIEIRLMPFSWAEVRIAKKDQVTLESFLLQGGFPEVVLSGINPKNYLSALSHSIIVKDIAKRHRIRNINQLLALFELLQAEFALPQSIGGLTEKIQASSKSTVDKYFRFLEDAYLVQSLDRYQFKMKEQLKAARKCYLVDVGLASDHHHYFATLGRRLENAVANELAKRGDLNFSNYFTRSGYEVDFCIRDGRSVRRLIQVSWSVENPDTLGREIRALAQAAKELGCKELEIISSDTSRELRHDGLMIKVTKFSDWAESSA